jgi:hypothetical protein
MGPSAIYILKEGIGKILTNIFETIVDDSVKTNVLGFRDHSFTTIGIRVG